MHDVSDMELLQDYDRHGSEAAFAALVQRHINLVYSIALRHVGIAAQAEEITQAVFIILSRKSAGLRADTILEGWLHETTRLTALSFLRGERRRQFREQEAYMQSTIQENDDAAIWNQLAPLLDEAVSRLGSKDRDAVMLRFFKEKSVHDVAATMQMSEAAAQRRILRALEKLRKFFTKRGVSSTTAIIAGMVSANSVQAAPVALAKSVTAVAIAKGAAATTSTLTLIKGALKIMAWTKTKTVIVVGVIAMFAAGTTVLSIKIHTDYKNRKIANALLEMHRQWAANDYHAEGMAVPKTLNNDQVSSWSAGILGAYVAYHFQKNGIDWTKRFHILRENTNTTTWTLYEIAEPDDTNLLQMAWQRKLINVTGNP